MLHLSIGNVHAKFGKDRAHGSALKAHLTTIDVDDARESHRQTDIPLYIYKGGCIKIEQNHLGHITYLR